MHFDDTRCTTFHNGAMTTSDGKVMIFNMLGTLLTIIAKYGSFGSKGGARDAPPRGPKFFQFHAVFGKIWQNRMLAPPPGELAPLLGEILDPPLYGLPISQWAVLYQALLRC